MAPTTGPRTPVETSGSREWGSPIPICGTLVGVMVTYQWQIMNPVDDTRRTTGFYGGAGDRSGHHAQKAYVYLKIIPFKRSVHFTFLPFLPLVSILYQWLTAPFTGSTKIRRKVTIRGISPT